MNFREQLSEAYKTGYNQGLQELYAGAHEGAHEEEEGYHEGAHEEDEGYHEEMDEKALAELGRMMIRAGMHEMDHEEDEGYHEGMHEGEHDEIEEAGHLNPFGVPDENPNIVRQKKALRRFFGKSLGGAMGDAAFGIYSPLYGQMRPGKRYSGIQTPFG